MSHSPAISPPAIRNRTVRYSPNLIVAFVLLQILCQIALLVPMFGAVRAFVRVAAFAFSLAFFAFLPGKRVEHPARAWIVASLVIVFLGLVHPNTNSLKAGGAQIAIYAATLAPLFWVIRLRPDITVLTWVLSVDWIFHTISACFGVLQVCYPGQFQPNLSTSLTASGASLEGLKISLASGERVFRPMGLTDIPGGAAGAGLYAFLFGVGYFLNGSSTAVRLAAIGSMAVGLFCVYLSHIRSILVVAVVCTVTLASVLLYRGDLKRLLGMLGIVPLVVVGSFIWAVGIGGDSVIRRTNSLVEDSPDKVYYSNRGHFLEDTIFNLLPQFPMGAGLGRWGMMNAYFGDNSDPNRGSLWAEIQWTAWLYDGGLALIVTSSGAVAVTCIVAWRFAISRRRGPVPFWAALILAYDIGTVALSFNYPIFVSGGGIEFWLLNALLFSAAGHATAGTAASRRPALP